MNDQNLEFLNKFVSLYQDLITHEGYGDIEVKIRLINSKKKEVRLLCGKEYRYQVSRTNGSDITISYDQIGVQRNNSGFIGEERRKGEERRDFTSQRRQNTEPRHFKLERRLGVERRNGRGRRHDD